LIKIVFRQKWDFSRIPSIKEERKLPEIMNSNEVLRIINAAKSIRDKAIISLIYAAGLRVSELCALKVHDIDSERMVIHNS
jgi:integrase/recombinase XerD